MMIKVEPRQLPDKLMKLKLNQAKQSDTRRHQLMTANC